MRKEKELITEKTKYLIKKKAKKVNGEKRKRSLKLSSLKKREKKQHVNYINLNDQT